MVGPRAVGERARWGEGGGVGSRRARAWEADVSISCTIAAAEPDCGPKWRRSHPLAVRLSSRDLSLWSREGEKLVAALSCCTISLAHPKSMS